MALKPPKEISVKRLANQKKAYNIIGICLVVISLLIIVGSIVGFSMHDDYEWGELAVPGLVLLAGIYSIFQARKIQKEIDGRITE
jgi:uncharacterized membrane protein YfcA